MIRQPPQKHSPESACVSRARVASSLVRAQAPPRNHPTLISTSRRRISPYQSISPLKYTTLIALITIFLTLLLQQTFVALKNSYHSLSLIITMTYIPGDNKVQVPDCEIPDHEPPPYAPTDPSLSISAAASEAGPSSRAAPEAATFPSADEEKTRLRSQDPIPPQPDNGESSGTSRKIPQSNAIKSSSSVTLIGPLEILGPVSSSGSVTLSNGVSVNGKISSSATVKLFDSVKVEGKVDASGSVKFSRGVYVNGKVHASGSVEMRDEVWVVGKVDASGGVTLSEGVKVEDKVDCSGSLVMRDGVNIEGDATASGKVKIESNGRVCVVGGSLKVRNGCVIDGNGIVEKDMKVNGSLDVNGRLHVKGDLVVLDSVTIGNAAEIIVDGKRTVHGKIKGLITTSRG